MAEQVVKVVKAANSTGVLFEGDQEWSNYTKHRSDWPAIGKGDAVSVSMTAGKNGKNWINDLNVVSRDASGTGEAIIPMTRNANQPPADQLARAKEIALKVACDYAIANQLDVSTLLATADQVLSWYTTAGKPTEQPTEPDMPADQIAA